MSFAIFNCSNTKELRTTNVPEIEDGFQSEDILFVKGSGGSRLGIKMEAEKEKNALESAKIEAQRGFRDFCRIGMDVHYDQGSGSKACIDPSLHTNEIKAAVKITLKNAELIKVSCKNEMDSTKTCNAYYKFTMQGLKPLCEKAARLAMAMCG